MDSGESSEQLLVNEEWPRLRRPMTEVFSIPREAAGANGANGDGRARRRQRRLIALRQRAIQ
jgi:hypothetical protein